ncbi:putative manganese ion binding protein [Trypoxylus dichotomus]
MNHRKLDVLKTAAGAQTNLKPEPVDDDDWETDPDFINDVTEQQRWGSNTVRGSGRTIGAFDMERLRRETEEADKKKKQEELLDGPTLLRVWCVYTETTLNQQS